MRKMLFEIEYDERAFLRADVYEEVVGSLEDLRDRTPSRTDSTGRDIGWRVFDDPVETPVARGARLARLEDGADA